MKTKSTHFTAQQQSHHQIRHTALLRGLCAGLFALTLATGALAQETIDPYPPIPAAPAKERANKTFLEKAHWSCSEESHISRVVAKRSTDPEVRDLASSLDSLNTSLDKDLAKLAGSKGVVLANLDNDNTKLMEKWSNVGIGDLDEDFVDAVVDEHEDTVKLFQTAATNTELDPAIAEFARKSLPDLQKQLAHAKMLDKKHE